LSVLKKTGDEECSQGCIWAAARNDDDNISD